MTYKEKLINHLKHANGIITTSDCKSLGIPTVYLSRLEKEGTIHKIDRGIYLSENGDYDEHYFFQYRFAKSIYSFSTALYLQGYTDDIPQYMDITVPRNYKFNNMNQSFRPHFVDKRILELGVKTVETPFGNPVRVYDFERIICDYIINRRKMDKELYIKTLQNYANYKGKNINNLYDYATKMNIITKVQESLEVLL